MTETNLRDEPWFKNAPEWMGEVVIRITEARDDARKLMSELVVHAEQLRVREEVMDQKQEAFVKAVVDMTSFANKTFGPDSAIEQINRKLDSIQSDNENWRRAIEDRLSSLERRSA